MKIAVISDIHGNMEALNSVMEYIEQEKCGKVFVLGDYAMAGPEPQKAAAYFIGQKNNPDFYMIQGNTDVMIANYTEAMYLNLKNNAPVMAEALKDDAAILNIDEKEFLRELPPQLKITIEGVKFLLVHGSPRRNNEDILPTTPLENVESMTSSADADVILCGHTHIPCGFQTTAKKTVVNAGSIGRPFTPEPKSCCLIITVQNGECTFEHHFIEYDKEKASEKLRGRSFKGADKLALTLLNPQERHF